MKAQVMKRAWEIVRELVGDLKAKLSMALRQAWAEVKAVAAEAATPTKTLVAGWDVEALEEKGAKRWTKAGHDRLYVKDALVAIMEMNFVFYNSGHVCGGTLAGKEIYKNLADGIWTQAKETYIDLHTGDVVTAKNPKGYCAINDAAEMVADVLARYHA